MFLYDLSACCSNNDSNNNKNQNTRRLQLEIKKKYTIAFIMAKEIPTWKVKTQGEFSKPAHAKTTYNQEMFIYFLFRLLLDWSWLHFIFYGCDGFTVDFTILIIFKDICKFVFSIWKEFSSLFAILIAFICAVCVVFSYFTQFWFKKDVPKLRHTFGEPSETNIPISRRNTIINRM